MMLAGNLMDKTQISVLKCFGFSFVSFLIPHFNINILIDVSTVEV